MWVNDDRNKRPITHNIQPYTQITTTKKDRKESERLPLDYVYFTSFSSRQQKLFL